MLSQALVASVYLIVLLNNNGRNLVLCVPVLRPLSFTGPMHSSLVFTVIDSGTEEADSMAGVRSREGNQQAQARSNGLGRAGEAVETTLGLQAC